MALADARMHGEATASQLREELADTHRRLQLAETTSRELEQVTMATDLILENQHESHRDAPCNGGVDNTSPLSPAMVCCSFMPGFG